MEDFKLSWSDLPALCWAHKLWLIEVCSKRLRYFKLWNCFSFSSGTWGSTKCCNSWGMAKNIFKKLKGWNTTWSGKKPLFIDTLQRLGTEVGDEQGSALDKGGKNPWTPVALTLNPIMLLWLCGRARTEPATQEVFKSSSGFMSWEGHKHWAAKLHSETFLLLWTNGYIRYKVVENQVLKLPLINCKMFAF